MHAWFVQVVTTLNFKTASVINEADKHTQDTLSCTEGHVDNSLWCLHRYHCRVHIRSYGWGRVIENWHLCNYRYLYRLTSAIYSYCFPILWDMICGEQVMLIWTLLYGVFFHQMFAPAPKETIKAHPRYAVCMLGPLIAIDKFQPGLE